MFTRSVVILVVLAAVAAAEERTSPEKSSRPATVLLVTADTLAEAWKPFAVWKTKLGKATKIVTIESIATAYEGRDIQEKIRACVQEHVKDHGTKWVILGGDSGPGGKGLVPDRDTYHDVPMFRMRYADLPADVYYISEKSWDADGDGKYGAWPADMEEVTYGAPGVSIGRIPVRTAADVAAYTSKVIAYESNYPTGTFATRMVYTCPEPQAYPKLKRSWNDHVGKVWKGEVERIYSGLTPDRVVKMLNDGYTGKIHIHGHGLLPEWVLEKRTTFTAKDVARLKNDAALPVVTTVSCFTGQFDAIEDPSIAESMLRHKGGGAIAIIAPAREGFPAFHKRSDFRLMMTEGKLDGTTLTLSRFWAFGLKDDLTVGEAFAAAKHALRKDAEMTAAFHLCASELNLLGDPTLDLRARTPKTPKVETTREGTTLTVTTDTPGATVCAWKGEEIYVVAKANEAGVAVIEVAPTTPGEIQVTVSGPSLNAVSVKVAVE